MLSDMYLIQGVFFQNQQWLGVACVPIEGNVAVIRSGLCYFVFSGVINRDLNDLFGRHIGQLDDHFGHSNLTNMCLTDDELTFVKKYTQRDYTINYTFKRQSSGIWVGKYSGEVTGTNIARCILTPITRDFFEAHAETVHTADVQTKI